MSSPRLGRHAHVSAIVLPLRGVSRPLLSDRCRGVGGNSVDDGEIFGAEISQFAMFQCISTFVMSSELNITAYRISHRTAKLICTSIGRGGLPGSTRQLGSHWRRPASRTIFTSFLITQRIPPVPADRATRSPGPPLPGYRARPIVFVTSKLEISSLPMRLTPICATPSVCGQACYQVVRCPPARGANAGREPRTPGLPFPTRRSRS